MKTKIAFALFTCLFAVPVIAAPAVTQVFVRQDAADGKMPYQSIGLIVRQPDGSTAEGYAFGISDKRDGECEELRAGYIKALVDGKEITFRAGAYASYFPAKGEFFVLPWVDGSVKLPAKAMLRWCLASHVPLNSGEWTLFSNEATVTLPIDKRGQLRFGIASTFFERGGAPIRLRIGPKLELKSGMAQIQLRYLPTIGEGKAKTPAQLRLQGVFALR